MRLLIAIYVVLLAAGTAAIYFFPKNGDQPTPLGRNAAEQRTIEYFNSVRDQPGILTAFLRRMPKGADLHVHLSGAVYAETLIEAAARAGLCIDKQTLAATDKCGGNTQTAASLVSADMKREDIPLYRRVVDAWSMRNWQLSGRSGHDQFFDTFAKFSQATGRTGELQADTMTRAADSSVSYLELMLTADNGASKELAKQLTWNGDFAGMRSQLLNAGLREKVQSAVKSSLDDAENTARALLKCDSAPQPGCRVKVRYIFQVSRGGTKQEVFSQIVAAFEVAQTDQRVVGLNLVEPEDYPVPRRDFAVHMQMLNYLRPLYQNPHIALHAGELVFGMVPPPDLRFHIRSSVDSGHAERIGHGVDVMNEDAPLSLLRQMAAQQIMVEICLTSNDAILGVRGKDHPLGQYLRYGVPVALATDDEGISRSSMSHEYLRAVQEQGLDYLQLKRMARTSLQFAFIRGESLWANADFVSMRSPCSIENSTDSNTSNGCQQFLNGSEKATLQWELEKAFAAFEQSRHETDGG